MIARAWGDGAPPTPSRTEAPAPGPRAGRPRAHAGRQRTQAVRVRPRARAAASWPAPTRPAAARSPGRSWRRRCCSTSSASRSADRRALSRLNDSKQHTAETPRGAVSARPARRGTFGRSSRVACAESTRRGLHVTNLDALRTALLGVAPEGTVCLVDGFGVPEFGFEQRAVVDGDCRSAAIAAASVLAKVTPRPLHAQGRRAPPRLGLRDQRGLLDPRAPRGDRGQRRLPAAPDVVPVDRLPAAGARRRSVPRPAAIAQVLEQAIRTPAPRARAPRARRPGRGDPDRIEAQLGRARAVARPRAASHSRAIAAAAPLAPVDRRERVERPDAARDRARSRVLTSQKTSAAARRPRPGRARRSGCGSCARSAA